MLLSLLQHLQQLLVNDSDLTSVVKAENIGASVRQPAGGADPSIEYGYEGLTRRDPKGHTEVELGFWLHASGGAEVILKMERALNRLMTAESLTPGDSGRRFKVSRCWQTDLQPTPRTDWADTMLVAYTLHLVDLAPVRQNQ
jgi:hypothetical protein